MNNKLKSLFKSRRFWAAAAGLIVVVAGESFGMKLDETQILAVAGVIVAWITGDTFRRTE